MNRYTAIACWMLPLTATLSHAAHPTSQPLRVDITSEAREDMRTVGWHNWHPTGGSVRPAFDDLTVSLRHRCER